MSAAIPAHTGPRLFDSPWEALRDLAAVTRRAKSLTAVYGRGRLDGALRERVLLAVSRVNCRGCTFVHTRWALRSGVTRTSSTPSGSATSAALTAAPARRSSTRPHRRRPAAGRRPPDVAAAVAAELAPAEIEAVEAVARMMALANLTASTAQALLSRPRLRRR